MISSRLSFLNSMKEIIMSEQNLEALAKQLESAIDSVKAQGVDLIAKTERGEKITEQVKADLDNALIKMNEYKAEIDELKQAVAGAKDVQNEPNAKSVGEQFTKGASAQLAAMRSKDASKAKMGINASILNSAGGLGGRTDLGFIEAPRQKLRVRDLLSKSRMDSDVLVYTRIKAVDNKAGYAAEGSLKPQSGVTFEEITTNPQVIAHWIDLSRQALSDNGFLETQINQILLYQLMQIEEQELLKGAGTSGTIEGLVTAATAFDKTKYLTMAKGQPFDVLRLAMAQSVVNNYPIDGFVFNPNDLADIQLTKDDVGRYIMGDPASSAGITSLWGVAAAESSAMDAGTWLGGNFAMGATLFDRWDATVQAGYKNDDFTKNMITLLAEERIALAIYSDVAFMTGDIAPTA